jgi:predicted Zn finger-like uncharacterized protein
MNVFCPHCRALYRVDPARVPVDGVRVRCAACAGVFPLARRHSGQSVEPAARTTAAPAPVPASVASDAAGPKVTAHVVPATSPPASPAFGPRDPAARARSLARALVSDMVAYHAERRDRSLAAGTLRSDFKEEILKSWQEYVDQVGSELARSSPYFREALNEILARGKPLF